MDMVFPYYGTQLEQIPGHKIKKRFDVSVRKLNLKSKA